MFHQMKLSETESCPLYRDRATTKGMDKRFKEIFTTINNRIKIFCVLLLISGAAADDEGKKLKNIPSYILLFVTINSYKYCTTYSTGYS